ncbi:MAG TPA: VTT domain-containing protein [Desulfurivibrionaceae bacterium]|nr:VTT domain-containing protein [Desulfurivibrionaceae bacterium]
MISRLTRPRAALILALAAIFILALAHWPDRFLADILEQLKNFQTNGATLRARILAFGGLAPALFIIIQVAQVVVAPIPGEASGFLGGYVFGAFPGFLYSSLGLTIGSALAFGGGRLLTAFFTEHFRHTSFYLRFNHLVSRGDFLIPFTLFLLPGFPKDSLCYLLGMSSMPWAAFLLITGVGRVPGTLMLSLQGAEAFAGNWLRLAVISLVSLGIVLPCLLGRHRILARFNRHRAEPLSPEESDHE